jgi:hypothetical protein
MGELYASEEQAQSDSYPETAVEVGAMLNGVCFCRSFDCHKNVVLIAMNQDKRRTNSE